MSTIDRFVGQQGSRSIDSSLPNPISYVAPAQITFQNDNPSGANPNQPVTTETAKMVEGAVVKAGVQSVNINSTTGGKHDPNSRHSQGKGVDINRVNGKAVKDANNSGAVKDLRGAFGKQGNIRENFGPSGSEKTSTPGGAPISRQDQDAGHYDHIHVSGQY